jgi:GNAT superfamily N-acetyltransferase
MRRITLGNRLARPALTAVPSQQACIEHPRLVPSAFGYPACDVYVLQEHRGKGLSKRMLAAISEHPDLQGLRRKLLVTRDAHGLYTQFGFKSLAHPDRFMELVAPNAYRHNC